jgi:hypothetical protein
MAGFMPAIHVLLKKERGCPLRARTRRSLAFRAGMIDEWFFLAVSKL